jgi:hypothetical protein
MDLNWLLKTAFVTAVRFSDSSGTSAPRGVLPISITLEGKVEVVYQDLFGVKVEHWTVSELLAKVWPNLQQTYLEVAEYIDSQVRLYVPCSKAGRAALDAALMKGRSMPKPKKAPATKAAAAPETPKGPSFPCTYADYSRRTCLAIRRGEHRTILIPMSEGEPFELEDWANEVFDSRYVKRLEDYPVAKAAELYARFAAESGASEAALRELGQLTPLTQKEIAMATAKKTAAAPAAKKTAPAKTTKGAAAVAAPAKSAKKDVGDGKPRESAAAMFQSLLLEGKHTDDTIFQKVAAKFGLDEKKRSYVGWYRNYLRKQGQTVADPITK